MEIPDRSRTAVFDIGEVKIFPLYPAAVIRKMTSPECAVRRAAGAVVIKPSAAERIIPVSCPPVKNGCRRAVPYRIHGIYRLSGSGHAAHQQLWNSVAGDILYGKTCPLKRCFPSQGIHRLHNPYRTRQLII